MKAYPLHILLFCWAATGVASPGRTVEDVQESVRAAEAELGDFRFRMYSNEPDYEVWQYFKGDENYANLAFYRTWAEHGYFSPEVEGVTEVIICNGDGKSTKDLTYIFPGSGICGPYGAATSASGSQAQLDLYFSKPSARIQLLKEFSRRISLEEIGEFTAIDFVLDNSKMDKSGMVNHTSNVCWPFCSSVYPIRVLVLIDNRTSLVHSVTSKVSSYQDIALCEYRPGFEYPPEKEAALRKFVRENRLTPNMVPFELSMVLEKYINTSRP